MPSINTSPQIDISVALNISNDTFLYFNALGQQFNGGATVTTPNTLINYRLIPNNNTLGFKLPVITAEVTSDITVSISPCKQIVTLIDSDLTNEDICVRLMVEEFSSGEVFESADPKIKNDPR
ncbi:DP-EP family protein [uncultured Paraglaciecola sp.]|uniref:DP-EP family protein n=1 Tax=uncultured Paraglaciecola sp. TaxID=1765024 RepID=UPI002592927B|nr:DP-EP family protein [uncultured Paraglaciecola sp.]